MKLYRLKRELEEILKNSIIDSIPRTPQNELIKYQVASVVLSELEEIDWDKVDEMAEKWLITRWYQFNVLHISKDSKKFSAFLQEKLGE